MKKTLIALMIATVSGSATAESGTVTFSGTYEVQKETPWEVIIGKGESNLDAVIKLGEKMVLLKNSSAIPILGIRTKARSFFNAASSISPQIDFGGMLDLNDGHKGMAKLSIPATGIDGTKIATLIAPLTMGAQVITYEIKDRSALNAAMIAPKAGDAFFGGLPTSAEASLNWQTVWDKIYGISTEFTKNFDGSLYPRWNSDHYISSQFNSEGYSYEAFYGSGIEANQEVGLLLDEPAKITGSISWVASLPITVSYM
ncbi:hypothetical protein F6T13_22770 [Escherichia coli]|nr:hypothetical protein [Escherichia coli]EGF7413212.1 hypothetical protein [Escherichia coli]EGF7454332.1 hypothetical protein [Escherichia coli]